MMAEDGLPTLEYGRYRLWQTPDGGWLLARAAFTCDRCQSCGCGEQQDHVTVPGMMVRLAEMAQNGQGPAAGPMRAIRRLMRRGNVGGDVPEGSGGSAEAAEGDGDPGADLAGVPAAGHADQEGSSSAGDGSEGSAGTV